VHPELTPDSLRVTVPASDKNPTPTTVEIPLEAPADCELLPSIQIFKSAGPAHLVCPASHPLSEALSVFLERPVAVVSKADTEPRRAGAVGYVDSLALQLDYDDEAQTGFADGFPFLFTTRPSLDQLSTLVANKEMHALKGYDMERWARSGPGNRGVEVERMRPNVVIDGPRCPPWEEDSWELVRFSSSDSNGNDDDPLAYVVSRCPRCPVSKKKRKKDFLTLSLSPEN
jgi:hypothetical protein